MTKLSASFPPHLEKDAAVEHAFRDLKSACSSSSIEVELGKALDQKANIRVLVGHIEARDREAFELRTRGPRRWDLIGASETGCARGLAYLADRVRVTGKIPRGKITMDPAFPLRVTHLSIGSLDTPDHPFFDESRFGDVLQSAQREVARAFTYGANHVILHSTYRVSDWADPPHSERTQIYRRLYREVARECHRYGMKCLIIGDEFLYQDRMLPPGTALSSDSPLLWDILQNRYRSILKALPDLDGVGVRIGEMLPIGNIRSFDVIHNASLLSLEEKYRRFVRAMYDVVAVEFNKLYLHRTWVVNDWEQHSVESIFRSIFADIPTTNLVISIKLTKTDQWWYQAFNPTFGQTKHTTCVELEMAHGPHGHQTYPDYMGEWFQAGLNYALGRGVVGAAFGFPSSMWMDAHHYAARRLMWEPHLSPSQLAKDWAAQVFGRKASTAIARMLLLSDDAMEKALYIRPYASTQAWNPLSHLLTGLFVVKGDPVLDRGKEHARFLRELYLLSKPHHDATLEEFREGLGIYDRMLGLFGQARPRISNKEALAKARVSMSQGRDFLALNMAYVTAFMRFFRYEEEATQQARRAARQDVLRLRKALGRYREKVGWYNTIGVETFLGLAETGLADLAKYREMLAKAPDAVGARDIMAQARRKDEALVARPDAEKVLHFEANVDGAELLTIKGDSLTNQHISDEATTDILYRFYQGIPRRKGTLAVRPIEVRGWAFVAEQPSEGNDWAARILVKDPQNGRSIYKFEAYWIPAGAQEAGHKP